MLTHIVVLRLSAAADATDLAERRSCGGCGSD